MSILTKLKEAIPKKKRGEASAPNDSRVAICPNPKCRRKIGEPILLRDLSTTPTKQYYACPHCFIKMDVISAQPQKKENEKKRKEEKKEKRRKKKKEEPEVKPPRKEKKGPSKCAGYLGYLVSFPKNKPIPQECLICPKVLDCVMKKSDSK